MAGLCGTRMAAVVQHAEAVAPIAFSEERDVYPLPLHECSSRAVGGVAL